MHYHYIINIFHTLCKTDYIIRNCFSLLFIPYENFKYLVTSEVDN